MTQREADPGPMILLWLIVALILAGLLVWVLFTGR